MILKSLVNQFGLTPSTNFPTLAESLYFLNVNPDRVETFPFSKNDVLMGSETELQTVVIGHKGDVDLPQTIEKSSYYANMIRRVAAGDTSSKTIARLESYLHENRENVWENSWIHFPMEILSTFARQTFDHDLKSDKSDPRANYRSDLANFVSFQGGEHKVRVPISYLLKLALADVIGSSSEMPPEITHTGRQLLDHFLNDNTSPETTSFHVTPFHHKTGNGLALAQETSKRLLLTHVLVTYANLKFQLQDSGQKAAVFLSPNTPQRQKLLNNSISDSFYRELFMSPCLSGWNCGEEKHQYMILCHQVLSRSHLNVVAKLRDAGIITNNLVVLPNTSNTSLANNGVHVTMSSRKMTALRQDNTSGLSSAHEKNIGDLVIKIVEHFLPLFVSRYSAAPYRLGFADFHPEQALGFLPHELDFTHLRMLWRRWKKKASNKVLGQSLTPFGPHWFDALLSTFFGLKGDFIPDFRLIDYLACVLSTDHSPALNGRIDNDLKLKFDLERMGVFDRRMSLYLLFKMRLFDQMGYCGFEGRFYSLFESLETDMAHALNLQYLVTALAFKYVIQGKITHHHIPDTPFVESERRQIFFDSAINIPTFFVHQKTPNLFLQEIISKTRKTRTSRRYQGYWRIHNDEYIRVLLHIIKTEAGDLIDMLQLHETIHDLELRLTEPGQYAVSQKLSRAILQDHAPHHPLHLSSTDFNHLAEKYYRNDLRIKHIQEGLNFLERDFIVLQTSRIANDERLHRMVKIILGEQTPLQFLGQIRTRLVDDSISLNETIKLANLLILVEMNDRKDAHQVFEDTL